MSNLTSVPHVGVSSWALHQELGSPPIFGVEQGSSIPDFTASNAVFSLLELPAELAKRGFTSLQICHFHLPSRNASYLDELRRAIEDAGLSLHALLVDAGDVTHPEHGARDEKWIADWLPVAARLGAQNVRVIAGQTVGTGAIERSVGALQALAAQAENLGVAIITENWFDLLSSPPVVRELLERTDGKIGFLLDFGNWSGPNKYENLAHIAPYASSCHSQAHFLEPNRIDEDDFSRCLNLPYPQNFNGPFILVNGGLDGIGLLRDFIQARQ